MKAWFWAADQAGSCWYRMILPAQALSWRGHDTVTRVDLPETHRDGLDVVVGARVANPEASRIWRDLRERGIRRVLDLDDDYFSITPDNVAAHQHWTPALLRALSANMAVADLVTVVSEPLAAVARQHADRVQVIPNALPAQWLGVIRDYRPDTVRVGWAGTASTVAELPLVARALRRIAEHPGCEVRLVGVDPAAAVWCGVAGQRVKTFGWVQQRDYLAVCSAFDVWVAPYRDTAFNRAKAATKALEAGFLGIPLVASAIRPYVDWVEHGVTGFLVRHEHEWGRYLKYLVDNPELRESMGMAARGRAADYVLQSRGADWETALRPEIEEKVA